MKWKELKEFCKYLSSDFDDEDIQAWDNENDCSCLVSIMTMPDDMVDEPGNFGETVITMQEYMTEYHEKGDELPKIIFKKGYPRLELES